MEQQTLRHSFTLEGIGIHTGKPCRITVLPAGPDTGRVFFIGDVAIPAHADYVVGTLRCTTLGIGATQVSTVEHLLSALYGCGVDNSAIRVEGKEIPILDGSSLPFVQAILAAGLKKQRRPARVTLLREPISLEMGESQIVASQHSALSLSVVTQFQEWPQGNAHLQHILDPEQSDVYEQKIAPARTFAFRSEVEKLLASGLSKGGSLENALIVTPPDGFSSPLRLMSEWCAHKMLDLVGDLALVNARLNIHVVATRPGHHINTRFASALLTQCIMKEG